MVAIDVCVFLRHNAITSLRMRNLIHVLSVFLSQLSISACVSSQERPFPDFEDSA